MANHPVTHNLMIIIVNSFKKNCNAEITAQVEAREAYPRTLFGKHHC